MHLTRSFSGTGKFFRGHRKYQLKKPISLLVKCFKFLFVVPQATPSAPFTIFTESQPPQKSDAPFSIFSDEAMETGHTENKENNDNRFDNYLQFGMFRSYLRYKT